MSGDDGDDFEESAWREDAFSLIRTITSVLVEYSSLVADADSPAGWALSDLRAANHDLLTSLETDDPASAVVLSVESHALIIYVIRHLGKDDPS